jgi:hypothetical protein
MRARLAALFSERARLFLLSVAISVTMWYYVNSVAQPATEQAPVALMRMQNVEVSFSGTPEGLTASADPQVVDVELRWPALAVLTLRPTDIQAIADVGSLRQGAYRVTLRIQVPSGVTTVRAIPPSVRVTLFPP